VVRRTSALSPFSTIPTLLRSGLLITLIRITRPDAPSTKAEYHPYDTDLPHVFEDIATFLRGQLFGIRIEHVGSTSVPGLGGRNVLDIVVAAPEADHEPLRARLVALGFQPSPFRHFLPLLVASASTRGKSFPVLLYLIASESDIYRGWIAFRDHMRSHPEDAAEYDRIKRAAIAGDGVDQAGYQHAKMPFLVAITNRIEKAGPTNE